MIRIEKHDWFTDVFAIITNDTPLLRHPKMDFANMSSKDQDDLRQTELFKDEVIRVLGQHDCFSLLMKFDKTIGWILTGDLEIDRKLKDFKIPQTCSLSALEFFNLWLGTPYVWGGLSNRGIDCSGFTQRYFLEIHGIILPKNSWDQRKLRPSKELSDFQDHDLVFCHRFDGKGTHHVVIYFDRRFWHSRRTGGVVCQEKADFLAQYDVEALISVI